MDGEQNSLCDDVIEWQEKYSVIRIQINFVGATQD